MANKKIFAQKWIAIILSLLLAALNGSTDLQFGNIVLGNPYPRMTTAHYKNAYKSIMKYFEKVSTYQLLAVRLGFHACMGGCDGCINLAQSDNAGLGLIVSQLNDDYNAHSHEMSRADFWAMVALVGIEMGVEKANRYCPPENEFCNVPPLNATFRYGRIDCPTSPNTTATLNFPSGAMNGSAMFSYFKDEFGFEPTEVTALMGVHTLGYAKENNSGYQGTWKPESDAAFNNVYYKDMLDANMNWTKMNRAQNVTYPKWQYFGMKSTNVNETMRLNTDFEVLYDVVMDSEGEASCSVQPDTNDTCARAPTYSTAYQYSQDVTLWVSDFARVFTKMIEHTNASLYFLT